MRLPSSCTVGFFWLAVVSLLLGVLSSTTSANQSIYADGLVSPFEDWSWGPTKNADDTTRFHSGTRSYSFTPVYGTTWSALYFTVGETAPDVSISGFAAVEFWVYFSGSQDLTFRIHSSDGNTEQEHSFSALNGDNNIPATTWTKLSFNFQTRGWTKSVKWVQFQSRSGDNVPVFIDDVVFVSAAPTIPPPVGVPVVQPPSSSTPSSLPPGSGSVFTINVDINSNRRLIDPLIYGANFASGQQMANARYTINRNGGNAATRYNWKTNVHSTAQDWFWMNIPNNVVAGKTLPEGSITDAFIDETISDGAKHMITLNLFGYVPLDDRTKKWSYSVAKYGAQDDTEQAACYRDWRLSHNNAACQVECQNECSWALADAGNGKSGGNRINAVYTDTSQVIDLASWNTQWLQHLQSRGTPAQFVSLDNEPGLWQDTHFDVWGGQGVTYANLMNKTLIVAKAAKAVSQDIKVTGPASWGWCEYWYSVRDGCGVVGPDRMSHGNVPFLQYYLQNLAAAKTQNGNKHVVDYLDIHYYPAVPNGQNNVALSSSEDAATVTRRFNAVKSLYDPNWNDDSWIQDVAPGYKFNLIPNMTALINTYNPGMKLAITEYSFGNNDKWSTALATAEALAIFGREGVDMATIWGTPAAGSPGENAFKIFRNYNGAGASVDGYSVLCTTNNVNTVPSYAIHDAAQQKVYVLVMNKGASANQAEITISSAPAGAPVTVYRFGKNTHLGLLGSTSLDASKKVRIPLNSWDVALAVVNVGSVPLAPSTGIPPASPPVSAPTKAPVSPPVKAPTVPPVSAPTKAPTYAPVSPPVFAPTKAPVSPPVKAPTVPPVSTPTSSTSEPTKAPVLQPTSIHPSVDFPATDAPLSAVPVPYGDSPTSTAAPTPAAGPGELVLSDKSPAASITRWTVTSCLLAFALAILGL